MSILGVMVVLLLSVILVLASEDAIGTSHSLVDADADADARKERSKIPRSWMLVFVAALGLAVAATPVSGGVSVDGKCTVVEQGIYSAEEERQRLSGNHALLQTQAAAKASLTPKDQLFQSSELVSELTNNNLEENVHTLNRNYVINVFAPWCPVCQVFDPLYNDLALQMSKRADVKFTIVNGDNDVDLRHRFKINSYPTLAIIKKGTKLTKADLSKSIAVYDGKRIMDDMIAWVNTECKTAWEKEDEKNAKDEKEAVARHFMKNAALANNAAVNAA